MRLACNCYSYSSWTFPFVKWYDHGLFPVWWNLSWLPYEQEQLMQSHTDQYLCCFQELWCDIVWTCGFLIAFWTSSRVGASSRTSSAGTVFTAETSSSGHWVHAKLIYKYQILYLDRITIVSWCYLVNDINLCRSPKSPKKIHKRPILAFKVIEFGANREPVYDFISVINSNLVYIYYFIIFYILFYYFINLGPISHCYRDTATYWPKIANFAHPPLI